MIIVEILRDLKRDFTGNIKKKKLTRIDLPIAGGPLKNIILLFSIK
jgi:hypothetical protein